MKSTLTKREVAALKGYTEAKDRKSQEIARQIWCAWSNKDLDLYLDDYKNGNYKVE